MQHTLSRTSSVDSNDSKKTKKQSAVGDVSKDWAFGGRLSRLTQCCPALLPCSVKPDLSVTEFGPSLGHQVSTRGSRSLVKLLAADGSIPAS